MEHVEDVANCVNLSLFHCCATSQTTEKNDKEFVILTRVYDEVTLGVTTKFLEMPICNMGNAENLYEK